MGNERASGPLTADEILEAVKRSGFPLEIRLLQAFEERGFDPTPPHRFTLGEGDKERSVEIDVTARAMETLAGHKGLLLLTLMIEAKQIHERVAFVGFKWKQPTQLEMRVGRTRFCGVPTCKVLDSSVDSGQFDQFLFGGERPAMAALDVFNDAPLCHHWCFVRDSKHKFIEATQEEDMRQSFRKLVHATTWLERESALFRLRHPSDHSWRVEIKFPTIVIATPYLYTFDPISGALEQTQSLILREMYEVGGEVHARYVDVVTEAEVPNLTARYRAAALALCTAFDEGVHAISAIVDEQRSRQQQLDNTALADSFSGLGILG